MAIVEQLEHRERFRGGMLGLAAGDALGAQVEFKPREEVARNPVKDMDRRTAHGNPPGFWTDDTSMGLCLAESLIECGGMNLVDQLRRYVRWWHDGHLSSTGDCFDIGRTTSEALHRFKQKGDPKSGGTNDDDDAGNGSIMRLVPVPLFFAKAGREEAVYQSGESSATTHNVAEAIDGCRYLGAILHAAVNGAGKEEFLSPELAPEGLSPKIAEIAAGSFKSKEASDLNTRGYVVFTLEAALWAFYNSDSFEEGALLSVNLGKDADTTGAVYGQIAGVHYGASAIPENWLDTITMREEITTFADRLHESARKRGRLLK